MTSPTLEPYREDIKTLLRQGLTRAEIKRRDEKKHGAPLGQSQFYEYVKQLRADLDLTAEEEPVMPLREVKTPESVLEDDTVRTFFVELPRAMQEMTEKLSVLEQKGGEHQQMMLRALREFHETLTGFDKLLKEQPAQSTSAAPPVTAKPLAAFPVPVTTVMIRQIWKRAFLVSVVIYLLIDVLFVWGWWRPLWDAIAG